MTSEKQIAANRRNAAKSSEGETEERLPLSAKNS